MSLGRVSINMTLPKLSPQSLVPNPKWIAGGIWIGSVDRTARDMETFVKFHPLKSTNHSIKSLTSLLLSQSQLAGNNRGWQTSQATD